MTRVKRSVNARKKRRSVLEQTMRHRVFHADPHPGNLRVLPSGVVVPLDYGMFGQLDAPTRERIADLLTGLLTQDTEEDLTELASPS